MFYLNMVSGFPLLFFSISFDNKFIRRCNIELANKCSQSHLICLLLRWRDFLSEGSVGRRRQAGLYAAETTILCWKNEPQRDNFDCLTYCGFLLNPKLSVDFSQTHILVMVPFLSRKQMGRGPPSFILGI